MLETKDSKQDSSTSTVWIWHIFIAGGHSYRGRNDQPPLDAPVKSVSTVECVAGRGLAGDRYFDYKKDYKGQITFFSWEIFEQMTRQLQLKNASIADVRRNVMIEGIDLNNLIGKKFEISGVRFEGIEECAPCQWMDRMFGQGAEEFLKGHGGLRAKISNCGFLSTGEHKLRLL